MKIRDPKIKTQMDKLLAVLPIEDKAEFLDIHRVFENADPDDELISILLSINFFARMGIKIPMLIAEERQKFVEELTVFTKATKAAFNLENQTLEASRATINTDMERLAIHAKRVEAVSEAHSNIIETLSSKEFINAVATATSEEAAKRVGTAHRLAFDRVNETLKMLEAERAKFALNAYDVSNAHERVLKCVERQENQNTAIRTLVNSSFTVQRIVTLVALSFAAFFAGAFFTVR